MNKQTISGIAIAAILLTGAAFYAGTIYAGMNISTAQSLQRQGGQGRGNRFGNGGFIGGKIIAKDATAITIELNGPNASSTPGQASGSKIVLYSNSTQVGKTVAGTLDDLHVGQNVSINGTQNPDGSITAQNIQIRPMDFRSRGQ